KGRVHEPGFVGVAPGSGEMRMPPVSVCHHVSTMGQRSPPMTRRYHIHASGLMGSPTEPKRRSDDRSWRAGYSSPQRMKARIAVGAVYKMVTRSCSMICQKRSLSGKSGAPSYI